MKTISIHAPRVGSDFQLLPGNTSSHHFNPRSPCGERPLRPLRPLSALNTLFQSTLPVWGATISLYKPQRRSAFQSTLPVWGATLVGNGNAQNFVQHFNPRSPCGERPRLTPPVRL